MKGQEIEIVATARLGTGLEHTKHVPGLCYYRNLFEIKSSDAKIAQIVEGSRGLVKEKKGSIWICDLSEAEADKVRKVDENAINDNGEILFFVESFGMMDAKDIIAKAIGALGDNLNVFEKELK
jgi:hypothetical protein